MRTRKHIEIGGGVVTLLALAALVSWRALVVVQDLSDVVRMDAASRATLVARTVSEAMNCGALACVIVAVAAAVAFVARRVRRRAS